MKKTLPFSMRLDPVLKAQLQELADQDHRNLSNYIEKVLRGHVADKQKDSPDEKNNNNKLR